MPTVDNVNGTPARPAARMPCTSPRRANIPAMPTGASASGIETGCPARLVEVSMADTSRITRWRNLRRAKSAALAAIVSSSFAPPSA